ncbi:MAG: T9SS type A sorting domain-containing protein [Cytophagales bacterium]
MTTLIALTFQSLIAQSLVGEWSYIIPDDQKIVSICINDSGYLAFGQGRNFDEFSELLKIDTAGNLIWRRGLKFADTTISDSYSFDMVKVKNELSYYTSGFYFATISSDYILKIDDLGDTLWSYIYNPFGIYQTTSKLTTLRDKSLLSVGFQEQGGTQEDVFVRRLDSMGKVMWEKMYPMPGNQRGFDITEMLDGSLIVSARSGLNNLIMRIDFNGKFLDSIMIPTISGNVVFQDVNLLFDNGIGLGVVSRVGTSTNFGQFIDLDSGLNIRKNQAFDQGVYDGPYLLSDSSYILNIFKSNDSLSVVNINSNSLSPLWSIPYGQVPTAIKFVESLVSQGQDLIVAGYDDTGSNQDYWLAKISGVGEEWIPDRCAYQPPIAGFDYEYNYPVLTLRDTSSGGLKYLDTVYTWQWNTSVGTNGTDDSLVVFFDTAITKTIDIELVIGNWYGCTDTVNQTLVLGETGLELYKELDVKVFPNPVKDILNVHIAEVQGDVLFSLYDLQGRLQFNQVLYKDKNTISISELPQGLYIYDLRTNAQVNRGKLIKK